MTFLYLVFDIEIFLLPIGEGEKFCLLINLLFAELFIFIIFSNFVFEFDFIFSFLSLIFIKLAPIL